MFHPPLKLHQPFKLQDLDLCCANVPIAPMTAPLVQLLTTNFSTLEFTTQKNGVQVEVIGLGTNAHLTVCPVHSALHCLHHLCLHNAPPNTPLASYFHNNSWNELTSSQPTSLLHDAVTFLGPATLRFLPSDVSACSLCAFGAMALLCARVDTDIIHLLGQWHYDEML